MCLAGCCHTLAGVWIEAEFDECPCLALVVTPSRVCGLKRLLLALMLMVLRHTLAGVWIEAPPARSCSRQRRSHTLAGVWIEAKLQEGYGRYLARHTLAGVWIEAKIRLKSSLSSFVTPSRVCGLKRHQ